MKSRTTPRTVRWKPPPAKADVRKKRDVKTRISLPVSLMMGAMLVAAAQASWMPLAMPERVQQADAIVILTITNVQRTTNGIYRSVAVGRIEQSLKGVAAGVSIQLPFENERAAAGSDPHYAKGERCLLFLRRIAPGAYTVLQSEFDKHLIKNEKVEETDGRHGMQVVPLTNILNQVTTLLSEKITSAQPSVCGDGKPAPQP